MNKINLKQILERVKPKNIDWLGFREVREITTFRMFRDGHPQANSSTITHGIMVEVLTNGQFGYYGVNSLEEKKIKDAVQKAVVQAGLAAKHSVYSFDSNVRPKAIGNYTSPYKNGFDTISPGDINNVLMKADEVLNISDKIVSRSSMAMMVETEFHYVCSSGSDVEQKFFFVTTDFSVNAQDGSIIQKRSDFVSHQAGMEELDENSVLHRSQRVAEQAIELLSADECPTETTNLVLAPDQMLLQIHESIGHALEIDRILGDERNYAGWSFVRPDDFDNLQFGSSLMNITFDPTVQGEFASYGFDDGGLEAKREYIIKDGILLRGLGGLESQVRSGLKGVANFRSSSWNRAPIDRMANLNLEPGESSYDDIINSIERGVYMESNRSWSIDDYRNKFQFGCEYAKLIENGKFTKTLKNPNYRGISNPFWNSLKMVGNQDTFEMYGTPYCGKGVRASKIDSTISVSHEG